MRIHLFILIINWEIVYYVYGKAHIIPYLVFPQAQRKTLNTIRRNAIFVNSVNSEYYDHLQTVQKFYDQRKDWETSDLGALLFKNIDTEPIIRLSVTPGKHFLVYVWDKFTEHRNTSMDHSLLSSSLEKCSVDNCIITRDESFLDLADAVLVDIRLRSFPRFENRDQDQIWILYSIESPEKLLNSCSHRENYEYCYREKSNILKEWADIFNWTMTYRSSSNVPVPYGRVVPLRDPVEIDITNPYQALIKLVPYWKNKRYDVIAVTTMLNCQPRESQRLLRSLLKNLRIDIHGGKDSKKYNNCIGHSHVDLPAINHYLFYLVPETSRCKEYITEKLFYMAYAKGAIPVIWGPSLEDCKYFLPPNSFLHADHYGTPEDLIRHMKVISENKHKILQYHLWRKNFAVTDEHGFFGTQSKHFCRLCEALNYNKKVNNVCTFEGLKEILDPELSCRVKK